MPTIQMSVPMSVSSCDADTDATATITLTSLSGMPPIVLTAANSPGVADNGKTALTNSFPKWAPFVQNLDEMNHLIWLTFSSTRMYGLRSPTSSNHIAQWTKYFIMGPG